MSRFRSSVRAWTRPEAARTARRSALALVLAAALPAACASAPDAAENEPGAALRRAEVPSAALARDLGLRRTEEPAAVVLEAASGARILLFPQTRIASVAGRTLDLAETLAERGGDLWIGGADADAIRSAWSVAAVASGAGASPGQRVPIPSSPPVSAGGVPAPRAPTRPAAEPDNAPTRAESAAWGVPLRRRWLYIVVHHSASATGSATAIDQWHRAPPRNWDGLGYDFVIGNGTGSPDGLVEVGYRWKQQLVGAHAKTADNFMNEHGIGICLVGDFDRTRPTAAQMRSLDRLCTFLSQYCGIPADRLRMHGEVKSTECPGRYFPRSFAIRTPSPSRSSASAPAGGGRAVTD